MGTNEWGLGALLKRWWERLEKGQKSTTSSASTTPKKNLDKAAGHIKADDKLEATDGDHKADGDKADGDHKADKDLKANLFEANFEESVPPLIVVVQKQRSSVFSGTVWFEEAVSPSKNSEKKVLVFSKNA